jgi:hypothetical protein
LNCIKKKERGPTSMKDIFGEGKFGCIRAFESNPPIKEEEVNILDALQVIHQKWVRVLTEKGTTSDTLTRRCESGTAYSQAPKIPP